MVVDEKRFTLNVVAIFWLRASWQYGLLSSVPMSSRIVWLLPAEVSPRKDTTRAGASGSMPSLSASRLASLTISRSPSAMIS